MVTLADYHKDLEEAKERNDEKYAAVVLLCEDLGIAEGELEIGNVWVDRIKREGKFKGFTVSRRIKIRQRDLDRFTEFLDRLVSSADMSVCFHYESSSLEEVQFETRLKAMQAAKEKAQALVEVVGEKLGIVLTVSEFPPSRGGGGSSCTTAALKASTDKFYPEPIKVRAKVYATFALE